MYGFDSRNLDGNACFIRFNDLNSSLEILRSRLCGKQFRELACKNEPSALKERMFCDKKTRIDEHNDIRTATIETYPNW